MIKQLWSKWRARRMSLAMSQIGVGRKVADGFAGDALGFRAGSSHASANAERRLNHATSATEWRGD